MVQVTFPCTKDQYDHLLAELQANPSGYIKFSPNLSGFSGELDTHDANLAYVFQEPTLTVSVTQLNSFLARHAPDDTVAAHVKDAISKYFPKVG